MIRRIQVRTSARDDWVDLTGEVQSVPSPPGPTWQNVFLCEFDGPRARDVILKVSP